MFFVFLQSYVNIFVGLDGSEAVATLLTLAIADNIIVVVTSEHHFRIPTTNRTSHSNHLRLEWITAAKTIVMVSARRVDRTPAQKG
jgi:hypothetical protein